MDPGGQAGLDPRLEEGLEVEARAPAKINLSLRVLGRRPDGCHELSGLMARLELADVLRIRLLGNGARADSPGPDRPGPPDPLGPGHAGPDRLTFGGPAAAAPDEGFTGPGNLVLRAAAAYRRATGGTLGPLAIHLVKNVALGAGLGGGSSDAAAVLRVLDASRLPGVRPLGPARLRELAASLGADVPFFLEDGPLRLAAGVGDRLAPFRGRLPGSFAVLANPGLILPTAAVFRRFALTTGESSSNSLTAAAAIPSTDPDGPGPGATGLPPGFVPGAVPDGFPDPGPLGRNDLWAPAAALAPELVRVRSLLASTRPSPLAVGLSGSGPTCWALHPGGREAEAARASFLDLAASEAGTGGWWALATAMA